MKKKANSTKKETNIYDPAKIESKWQKKWQKDGIYNSDTKSKDLRRKDQKFYILDMFPYPSGDGLHVGHPKGYIATDIISRMKRMQGYSVLHPMGFDAFGLPAENYAIKMKVNPDIAVKDNVKRFKKQLEIIGLDYDWSREINTTDPSYYHWTQWIFLQLYKKGLAYESYEPINWCPVDKTGLANEDIENGRCERCGALVEKKPMRQWVLKITDYAEKLLADLDLKVIPEFTKTTGSDAFRLDMPVTERPVVHCLIKHWKDDSFLCMKWKVNDWRGYVIGGIEKGETVEQTAIREVIEETGYKNVVFKKVVGNVVAKFYQEIKKLNRKADITTVYLELLNGEQNEVADHEKVIQDMEWVPRDKVRDFVNRDDLKYEWDVFTDAVVQKPLLDWPNNIKELQRNWIGKSEGAEIDFRLMIKSIVKPRFVLLHGYKGSSKEAFFPWLKNELEKQGHEVESPELPDTSNPKEEEQLEYVLKNCHFDENTVIVGHSLGGVLAQKLIMKMNKPISGLVLVAPAVDPKFPKDVKIRPFHKTYNWNLDYKLINHLCQGRIAVLSDSKEAYRSTYLKYLADQLKAKFIEVDAEIVHFNGEEEPEILKAVIPSIKVFTTRPDTLFGVTYVVLAPEHRLVSILLNNVENKKEVEDYINKTKSESEIDRTDAKKEKTGVELKNIKAVNPVNKQEVPVWISDYVLADYGTGAVMAVPAHDDRDWEFAKIYKLPVVQVIAPYLENKRFPVKEGLPIVNRRHVNSILRNPKTNEYACLKWNEDLGWTTLIGGGVEDGENLQTACEREIREESGYQNLKYIREIGRCFGGGFAAHKNENRFSDNTCLLYELIDETKKEVSESESIKHKLVWLKKNQVEDFLNVESSIYLWNLYEKGFATHTGDGLLINSDKFDNKNSLFIKKEITDFASGKWVTTYKLRDWVFSRQRYWGEPIPLINCDIHGVVPVPEDELPVKLPKVKSYEPTGTGESPLAAISSWVNVKCPKCKGKAKRETNTMPQWAGSCWYYLRYMDPNNKKAFVDPKKEKYWAPVDLYVGGAEHATRHLIYARFWHKVLFDLGLVSTCEPFTKLQPVGLIMGEDGRKMSKRFGNVVNPDDVIKQFGADTLRLYEMFMGPFDQQISWSTTSIVGARRFIEKVWRLGMSVHKSTSTLVTSAQEIDSILNKTLFKVSEDIENLRFNTAISALMIAVNEIEKLGNINKDQFFILLKLLAPFIPHAVDEMWTSLGNKKSIHISEWPKFDQSKILNEKNKIAVQVNGKMRASLLVEADMSEDGLKSRVFELPEIKKWTEGKEIKKVIIVKNKLVSIVVA